MNPAIVAAAVVGGYLIGSISFARIIFARLSPGTEPLLIETPTTDGKTSLVARSVGATNVMVAFGPKWGMATMALDAAKAFFPTLAFGLAFPDQPYDLICATAVLVGHLFPVWYRFSGGGGNSSVLGMLLAISPLGAVITHAGGYLIGRIAPPIAYMAGVALTIPWFAWRNGIGSPEMVFGIAITFVYCLGQLPELVKGIRIMRQGHKLDVERTMRLMKEAASGGRHDPEADDDSPS